MALEAGTYIDSLVPTNPVGGTDPKSQGDDHLRLLKSTIKNSFPNITGAMTASHTDLNTLKSGTGIETIWIAQNKFGGVLPRIDTPSVNTDWNTLTLPGWHGTVLGTAAANAPVAGFTYMCHTIVAEDANNVVQLAIPDVPALAQAEGIFVRSRVAGVWNAWRKILWSTDVIALITAVNTAALTFSNKTLIADTVLFADQTDPTKKIRFALAGITTATTRVVTFPNYDITVASIAGVESFSNKTLVAPIITAPIMRETNDGVNGPVLNTEHVSASPAANDVLFAINVHGRDTAAALRQYTGWITRLLDATAASIDATWEAWTAVANTLTRRLSIGAGLWMEGATGGDPGVGKINATEFQQNGVVIRQIVQMPAIAVTGLTEAAFAIPSWAKRISLDFITLSVSGSSQLHVQLSDAEGYEVTGYVGTVTAMGDSGNTSDGMSIGFKMLQGTADGPEIMNGGLTVTNVGGNRWSARGNNARSDTDVQYNVGGGKTLSSGLNGIRLIATATFDSGFVNVTYEG